MASYHFAVSAPSRNEGMVPIGVASPTGTGVLLQLPGTASTWLQRIVTTIPA